MPDEYTYPIENNRFYVNPDDIERYLEFVFGAVDWQEHQTLGLRGIGEKRTPKEGKFQSDVFVEPYYGDPLDRVVETAKLWAAYHTATFCVPAVLKSHNGSADQVELFTVVLADLDSGNTDEKIAYMAQHIGVPSMVVQSGGTTETGHDKRHVYYRLSQPTRDIRSVIVLRDKIWRKCGGDPAMGLGVQGNPFGRAHQPVRIAGTCHAKSGQARSCKIEYLDHQSFYDLETMVEKVDEMPAGPWLPPEVAKKDVQAVPGSSAGLFSPTSGGYGELDLTTPVHEGGDTVTRWGKFSQVAGHYIHLVRRGEMDLGKALEGLKGWVVTTMVPPWDEMRVEKEFRAILDKDLLTEGPLPQPRAPLVPLDAPEGIMVFAAHRWVTEPRPVHEFLVDQLIIKGEPHLFAAEGGAGKTGLLADLAMKIAAHKTGDTYEWCGQKIMSGGEVVVILNEDSKTEMHIRLLDLDSQGLISKAGDNLIILPMTDKELGGAFPLVSTNRDGSTSSVRWNEMMAHLGRLKNLKAVFVDTFNSILHGDENSSVVISEVVREATRVTGQLGAALIFTHHVRKANGEPIKNLADLRDNIRGSSAILGSFRIVLGMFMPTDWRRRLEAMKLPTEDPTLIWLFGVCKANINGLMKATKTLTRNSMGLLDDATEKDVFANVDKRERLAWLVYAVEKATEAGHPYKSGKGFDGLYSRRSELPHALRHMGGFELNALVEAGLQHGLLMATSAPNAKSKSWIDVTGGLLSADNFKAAIKSGAYASIPQWDNYAFDSVQGTIQPLKGLAMPKW